jgi:hypothetical protein
VLGAEEAERYATSDSAEPAETFSVFTIGGRSACSRYDLTLLEAHAVVMSSHC